MAGQGPMSQRNQDALVALKLDLKNNIKMFQLRDILEVKAGGFMNRGEAVNVRAKKEDADQMGELIEILQGKGDAQFLTFCTMLERSGYQEWAYKLKLEAGIANPGEESPLNVADTGGSGELKSDVLSQKVTDRKDHLMLFREYVSSKAARKGKAVLEGVGLDSNTIEDCFENNPGKNEAAVQAGLVLWKDGQGLPNTWGVLIEAMKYAKIAKQHIDGLMAKLGLEHGNR